MKKIFLFFSLLALTLITHAQKDNQLVTFDNLGPFKLGMSKAELEKLVGAKIVLKHIRIDEAFTETVKVMYKGSEYDLDLGINDKVEAQLEGVSSSSPLYKTAEGIGIGSDLETIVNTYEKHMLIITAGTITYANIDNIHASIVFYMEGKKVVKIEVEPTAAFLDRE